MDTTRATGGFPDEALSNRTDQERFDFQRLHFIVHGPLGPGFDEASAIPFPQSSLLTCQVHSSRGVVLQLSSRDL